MATPLGSIIKLATRQKGDRINVLTFSTHESYQTSMQNVNAEFYLLEREGLKTWQLKYRPLPRNHHVIHELPLDVDFDVVLSQNNFAHYALAKNISTSLGIPLVNLTHTLPHTDNKQYLEQARAMSGTTNVFISNFSRGKWLWGEHEARIINHGIDTKQFSPARSGIPKKQIFSCVNDWRNRDFFCGYFVWERITQGLPTVVLGDNPGLSRPANSVLELVQTYQQSQVFLNTSLVSPVPTSLLEAMACGCLVVSTATCMIPEIIINGVNGFLSNDEGKLRNYLEQALANPSLCKRLGDAARQTILDKFSLDSFTTNWNNILEESLL